MHINKKRKGRIVWVASLIGVVLAGGAVWGFQLTNSPVPSSTVFTPAHPSIAAALREFFDIRSTPVQPIAYTHTVHVLKNQQKCVSCHVGVDKAPEPRIPNVKDCMECHEFVKIESPEIQKIAAYQKRGEEIPWQRVYGFVPMAHVRFNHAPHIRKNIDCSVCHGDVSHMTTAQRVVDHTMGFCLQCHDGKKASNDCMTCHY